MTNTETELVDKAWRKFKLALERQSMQGRDYGGMWRYHTCWKCREGEKPCVAGNPRQCEYPHARND